MDSGRYWPSRQANACAPASIARQSWPRGDGDRVDAVHHALVVGRGAVGIRLREAARLRRCPRAMSSPGISKSASSGTGNAAGRARQPAVGQVGEDAQVDLAAGDLLDQRGHALGHGVDQVRAHRLLGVDEHVDDQQRLAARALGRRQHAHLDVLAPPPRLTIAGGSCWPAPAAAPWPPGSSRWLRWDLRSG